MCNKYFQIMEDVYTIKVKTKRQNLNCYPSEKRYSASTVLGLAWIHLALATTSLLLTILAFINPVGNGPFTHLNLEQVDNLKWNDSNIEEENIFESLPDSYIVNYSWLLILAPAIIMISALSACLASILASMRWYIDKNITWLFCIAILSAIGACIALIMAAGWLVCSSRWPLLLPDLQSFPSDVIVDKNETYYLIKIPQEIYNRSQLITKNDVIHVLGKRGLAINILIAAILEFLWSLLTVKISWKGMNNTYKEDAVKQPPENCLQVLTTVKGNNIKNHGNIRILPPKPDILLHYPTNTKTHRIYLSRDSNGFYLRQNTDERPKMAPDETHSQYRERMLDFLNRCDSFDGSTLPDSPSLCSDHPMKDIPEENDAVSEVPIVSSANQVEGRLSSLSWGDSHELPVYNPDTLDLEKIINAKLGIADKPGCDNRPESAKDEVSSNENEKESVA